KARLPKLCACTELLRRTGRKHFLITCFAVENPIHTNGVMSVRIRYAQGLYQRPRIGRSRARSLPWNIVQTDVSFGGHRPPLQWNSRSRKNMRLETFASAAARQIQTACIFAVLRKTAKWSLSGNRKKNTRLLTESSTAGSLAYCSIAIVI